MAKIVITIQDTESGKVQVDSTPHMRTLAQMARNEADLTPAVAYALAALAKIIKDSQDNLRKEVEDKVNRGLLTPTPRFS